MTSDLAPDAKRLALIILVILTATFLALLPFAKVPLTPVPPFIGAYDTTLVFNCLLTSLYFFCHYYRMNSYGTLLLGISYLYESLMIVPHALSYPGLFADQGLLGGGSLQTTPWIYMLWHGGFPLCTMAYCALPDQPANERRGSMLAILFSIVAVMSGTVLLTSTLAAYIHSLPDIIVTGAQTFRTGYTPAFIYVVSVVWGLGLGAMWMLWRKKTRSTTDLWLIVVLTAWLFDVGLSAVFNHGRYDLGFYSGRVYGLIAAGFVLVMLIIDTSRLNERLVVATTQLADYADTLEERVRQRTELLTSMERQLAQSQKMEAIGNLTGGIAHDFNNLLNVIIGNLDVLSGSTLGGELDEVLKDVMTAALRGRDMTKRLLAFARRQPLKPQRTEVNALIEELFRLLERTLGSRISVTLRLAENLWPVAIDPGQLDDAITNLTTNSRDAMPQGGQIFLTTYNQYVTGRLDLAKGEYVVIEFADTGSGISPEVMEHIFEPFYTTKEQGKGTGLGLSMVFGFLKQSGGHITVSSTTNSGTTFKLFLPRYQEPKKPVDAPDPTDRVV